MDYYGVELISDSRLRPEQVRLIPNWLGNFEWAWPKRRRAPGPRRPFDYQRDRWSW
jgi:hypothetical protein